MPNTLFFRLFAVLVHKVKGLSDAFEYLYVDRVVIKTHGLRYLLCHHAKDKLTVYSSLGCKGAPATVMRLLKERLGQLQDSFGVKYRFEAYSDDLMGESGWFPLETLREQAG